MNKHYIRLDINNNIIKGFSDAFETPLETDICVNENGQRHFELFGEVNPNLSDIQGIYLYMFDGQIVVKTDEKIQNEINIINNIPKRPTTEEQRFLDLEMAIAEILGGGL
jgi:hypothetical protein